MGFGGGGASRPRKYISLRKEGLHLAYGKGDNRVEETGRQFTGKVKGADLRYNPSRGNIPEHYSFTLDLTTADDPDHDYRFEMRESDPGASSLVNTLAALKLEPGDSIALISYEASNGRMMLSVKREVGGERAAWLYPLGDERIPDCPLTGELTRAGNEARDWRPRQLFFRGVFVNEVAPYLGYSGTKRDAERLQAYFQKVDRLTKAAGKKAIKVAAAFEKNLLGLLEEFADVRDQDEAIAYWQAKYEAAGGKDALEVERYYGDDRPADAGLPGSATVDADDEDEADDSEAGEIEFD